MDINLQRNWKSLFVFLAVCYLTLLFGGLFRPGEWYANLNIAPWNPPNLVFPIVWAILYIFIAIAGWRIFSEQPINSKIVLARRLWITQLLLNGIWSWIFFGQHWVAIALIEILILDFVVAYLIIVCATSQLKVSSWLLAPYLTWLLLATSLTAYVLIMN